MKKITIIVLILSISISLTGCAFIDSIVERIQGDLIGDNYKILVYDDYGNNSLTMSGSNISIGLFENYSNSDSESNGFKSEVLEITVNSDQFLHVGSTAVFAENGISMVEDYDYEYLKNLYATGNPTLVPIDRAINSFSNLLGMDKTIIIKSQLGVTIGIYEGNNVYVEVPDDLPQMTRVIVDGKSLYIYRADYEIFDTKMIKVQ
jgi:hypothetical protein